MRTMQIMFIAMGALALAGCRNPTESGPIELLDAPPEVTELQRQAAAADEIELLDREVPVRKMPGTEYYTAEDAPECPTVEVTNEWGERDELKPATPGYVTIVAFWAMDWPNARAVARYASELERRYKGFRVRAIGILMKTANVGVAVDFAEGQGMTYPQYVDDVKMSALRKLADAAGAEDKNAMPAVFIMDRRQRIRFYRPGFGFVIGGATRVDPSRKVVLETAPPGDQIEDYLKRILQEG